MGGGSGCEQNLRGGGGIDACYSSGFTVFDLQRDISS